MPITRTQGMAQAAWIAVQPRKGTAAYASFAKSFPALIHTAGLCQAVAFAQAKQGPEEQVLVDVMKTSGLGEGTVLAFADACRSAPLPEYLRRTRLMLSAASWVKRYVEALEEKS